MSTTEAHALNLYIYRNKYYRNHLTCINFYCYKFITYMCICSVNLILVKP